MAAGVIAIAATNARAARADWSQYPWWTQGTGGEYTYTAPMGETWTIPAGQSIDDAYAALVRAAAGNTYKPARIQTGITRRR